ncbi:hypothetical protein V495_06445 [Pseudogymnoascus sp. VKM F-4514 (FW-929)]|nr:hypothetical protein V495_06445 [Pseudogymnoascus sp. VKM F-4514 (FW-929)]KFY63426.1 hypothetical protein V497_02000 [Pseudogymnoascus sp. VKM F-4516 (FW-969)]
MPSPQEWLTSCPCDETTMKPSTLWAIQTAGLTVGTSYGYTLTAAAWLSSHGDGGHFGLIGIRSNVRLSSDDLGTYFELSSKEPTTLRALFTSMAIMFSAPVGEAYNFLPDQKNFCLQGSQYAVNAPVDFQALLDFKAPKDVEAGHPTTPTTP